MFSLFFTFPSLILFQGKLFDIFIWKIVYNKTKIANKRGIPKNLWKKQQVEETVLAFLINGIGIIYIFFLWFKSMKIINNKVVLPIGNDIIKTTGYWKIMMNFFLFITFFCWLASFLYTVKSFREDGDNALKSSGKDLFEKKKIYTSGKLFIKIDLISLTWTLYVNWKLNKRKNFKIIQTKKKTKK